jgi:hypothetical protein
MQNDVHILLVQIYNVDKGNNKITELRTIFQRESQNS